MEYRLNKKKLLEILAQWNPFLKKKVHLIACGGTAMTLLDVKPSTKDVDFIVPDIAEYKHLIGTIKKLDYKLVTANGWLRKGDIFRFDLFPGKRIHTTELLRSPMEPGNHRLLVEFTRIYVGILNEYDLIASKLMRGTRVDFEDCLMLVKASREALDIKLLEAHFHELVSYDISEKRIGRHMEFFIERLREEKLYDG